MREIRNRCLLGAVAAMVVVGCSGGGDDETGDEANDATPGITSEVTGTDGETDDPDDTEAGAGAAGPVNGALVSVLDLGLGLYAIDRETGESFELDYAEGWYTDRNTPPFVVGDRAYSLVFRQVDDETFLNETAVAEFDLTTGVGREVVGFGPDRESAESPAGTSWELYGAGDDALWLRRADTDDAGATTSSFVRHSITTGEITGEITGESTYPEFEIVNETATCSSEIRPFAVGTDGSLFVTLGGYPAMIDGETLEPIVLVEACGSADPTVATHAGEFDPADFVLVENDAVLTDDQLARAIDTELSISSSSVTVADDAIWWIFNRSPQLSDGDDGFVLSIVGGATRLDRTTGELSIFPLGDAIGEFLDAEESGGFDLATMSQATLHLVGDSLWIMDRREARPLLRLDATTGEVTEIEIPLGDGNDFVEAELLPTDPEAVWLEVSRRVIQPSEDGAGRSTVGLSYIDQVDPVTGEFVRSIPESDLTGMGG